MSKVNIAEYIFGGMLILSMTVHSTDAQQLRTQNFSSAGSAVSTAGTQRLISVVGQPIVFNSSVGSETKAGFLQAARELINDNQAPVISYTTTTQGITQGVVATFTATIQDNVSIGSAKIYYKPIASPSASFQNTSLTAGSNNTYTATTQTTWFDSMGMEYYFTATDGSNNSTRSPATGSYYSYLTNPAARIPASVLSSGTQITNYRIIAMPYSVNGGDAIVSAFGSSSGLPTFTSDKTKWRLATYDPTGKIFIEYPDKLSNFERGRGYWFILKNPVEISLGQKSAPANNRNSPFMLTLKPGWNMIGNPYPLPIKWDDVKNFQGNPSVGDLNVYAGGYAVASDLPAFQGGFVNNTGATDLVVTIPFSGQSSPGGRIINFNPGSDISANDWQVNLDIYQGETFNKLTRFGMASLHTQTESLNAFNPPAFGNSPEINFKSRDDLKKLSRSIIPVSGKNTWRFTAAGEPGELTELVWNPDLGHGSEPLFLLDEVSMQLINMREVNRYAFMLNPNHPFSISFGKQEVIPGRIIVMGASPNPAMERKTTIQLGLPDTSSTFHVGFQVFNGSGAVLNTREEILSPGVHTLRWEADDRIASGLYYYRVLIGSGSDLKISTGKIVVP